MDNDLKTSYNSGYRNGISFGLVLMLIGVLFLGFNFGIIPHNLKHVIFSWQMLLILLGVINLIKRHLVSGTVLILIGGFFIMPKLIALTPFFPFLNGNFTEIYWPLLLILAGILIILGRTVAPKWWNSEWEHHAKFHQHHHRHERNFNSYSHINSEYGFSKNSIFSSGKHIVLEPEFKGGEMNAVFGGITLDLRKTTLKEGNTYLEVNAVFGGITIFIPENWYVETHLDAVFGGFEDKRLIHPSVDTSRKLIITGSCVFGGGEIRN